MCPSSSLSSALHKMSTCKIINSHKPQGPSEWCKSNLEISELTGKLWVGEPQSIICSQHSLPPPPFLHHKLLAKVVGLAAKSKSPFASETVGASGFGIAIYCSSVCDQWYYYHIHQTVQEKVQNLFKLSSSDGKGTIKPVLVQEMSARKYETLNMWEIQLNWSTSDELRNWRCNYETGGAR